VAIRGTLKESDCIMEEIVPGIFCIPVTGRIRALMPPVNVYVLAGKDGLIFDGGYGTRHAVAQLRRGLARVAAICRQRGEPCRFGRILPSHAHPDHFAGLNAVARLTGAEIWLTQTMAGLIGSRRAYGDAYAPDTDRPSGKIRQNPAGRALNLLEGWTQPLYEALYGMRFVPKPDRIVSEEGVLSVNGRMWQILAMPGHSDDHIVLYDPDEGVLLGGDNVLRTVTTWLGPPRSNLNDYLQSLKRMAALPGLKLILSAHGSPVRHPRERIAEIIDWREHRTRQVLDAVTGAGPGGIGAGRLIRRLYRGESPGKWYMAEGWVLLTLDDLVAGKWLSAARRKGRIRFFRGRRTPKG
jgi:glyoxylase-like metal-dependent hydrolase (beta-lactamase superfamily II)